MSARYAWTLAIALGVLAGAVTYLVAALAEGHM